MAATTQTVSITNSASKPALWGGRILGGLAILFLIFDGLVKVMQLPQAVEPTVRFGFAASMVLPLGVLELVLLATYCFPRTAVLGAVLFTGYLGGAVATQARVGADAFSIVFPFIIGAMMWGALLLRNRQLRALVWLQN